MRIIGNNPAADNAEITAVASGTLPNGKPVIVNSDGTVSVVAETAISQALGSAVVFESAALGVNAEGTATVYDASTNKVVIAYADGGNSSYGTAVVGTVSGTSISFGTPVVFLSSQPMYIAGTYDSTAGKVVFAFRDQASAGYSTAIVGTVSGTSISFGAKGTAYNPYVEEVSVVYSPAANKVVMAYRDNNSSGYGASIVGTISGTNISFGGVSNFESAATMWTSMTYDSASEKIVIAYQGAAGASAKAKVGTIGATMSWGAQTVFDNSSNVIGIRTTADSTNGKVVIGYADAGNSYYGTVIIGTVSGTSISFGTPVVFSAVNTRLGSLSYDSDANKISVAYYVTSNNYGKLITGTVSGTSITFDSVVSLSDGSTSYISSAFDSGSNRVVIAWPNGSNSNYGTARVLRNASTVPNLTAENYIGFANGAAADTGTARVQIGSGINGAQSSLTAGQQYFVQTDGTLGLTAADPSVIAGTAVSATDIIVKG